ncbi:hypothetical protein NDU88_000444 [Pleurodeles waltl]|uniref:Uncharacterized protein n=1 Tax=Pleurodeles waltl TaxID=8319 RepID=A0AAV7SX09_PLEWA|nr:hypothetical protein NDU88_000444 [Pleurodeles waltl]
MLAMPGGCQLLYLEASRYHATGSHVHHARRHPATVSGGFQVPRHWISRSPRQETASYCIWRLPGTTPPDLTFTMPGDIQLLYLEASMYHATGSHVRHARRLPATVSGGLHVPRHWISCSPRQETASYCIWRLPGTTPLDLTFTMPGDIQLLYLEASRYHATGSHVHHARRHPATVSGGIQVPRHRISRSPCQLLYLEASRYHATRSHVHHARRHQAAVSGGFQVPRHSISCSPCQETSSYCIWRLPGTTPPDLTFTMPGDIQLLYLEASMYHATGSHVHHARRLPATVSGGFQVPRHRISRSPCQETSSYCIWRLPGTTPLDLMFTMPGDIQRLYLEASRYHAAGSRHWISRSPCQETSSCCIWRLPGTTPLDLTFTTPRGIQLLYLEASRYHATGSHVRHARRLPAAVSGGFQVPRHWISRSPRQEASSYCIWRLPGTTPLDLMFTMPGDIQLLYLEASRYHATGSHVRHASTLPATVSGGFQVPRHRISRSPRQETSSYCIWRLPGTTPRDLTFAMPGDCQLLYLEASRYHATGSHVHHARRHPAAVSGGFQVPRHSISCSPRQETSSDCIWRLPGTTPPDLTFTMPGDIQLLYLEASMYHATGSHVRHARRLPATVSGGFQVPRHRISRSPRQETSSYCIWRLPGTTPLDLTFTMPGDIQLLYLEASRYHATGSHVHHARRLPAAVSGGIQVPRHRISRSPCQLLYLEASRYHATRSHVHHARRHPAAVSGGFQVPRHSISCSPCQETSSYCIWRLPGTTPPDLTFTMPGDIQLLYLEASMYHATGSHVHQARRLPATVSGGFQVPRHRISRSPRQETSSYCIWRLPGTTLQDLTFTMPGDIQLLYLEASRYHATGSHVHHARRHPATVSGGVQVPRHRISYCIWRLPGTTPPDQLMYLEASRYHATGSHVHHARRHPAAVSGGFQVPRHWISRSPRQEAASYCIWRLPGTTPPDLTFATPGDIQLLYLEASRYHATGSHVHYARRLPATVSGQLTPKPCARHASRNRYHARRHPISSLPCQEES